MTGQQFIKEIRSFCNENANEANVIKYSRYFKKDKYNTYGLTASQMESKSRDLQKRSDISLSLVLEAAPALIQNTKHEEAQLTMLVVRGLQKQYSLEAFKCIENWFSIGIINWAQADLLATGIIPLFLNKKIIEINDLKSWLEAPNKFQRRSVPVALIKSLKTHDNFTGLFTFIRCLMTDPEREVHQGTGWFLREAWKRKPEETEAFLLKWKDISPRLIFQYATEKMTPEEKNKFRRQRV